MTSSIIDNFFDKIYYINLKKDFDRNINILKEFEKFNIRNFQRMEGVEISDLPDQWLYRSFIKKISNILKALLDVDLPTLTSYEMPKITTIKI